MTVRTVSFEEWMKRVDLIIQGKTGLSYLDLADIRYRDLYNSGSYPSEAAQAALANEGFEYEDQDLE